jgi:molybdate transport system regulatory protein
MTMKSKPSNRPTPLHPAGKNPLQTKATWHNSGTRPSRLIDAELVIGGGLNSRLFELLAAIERRGSIVHAAREAGLSYKGAWQMIERASSLSPRPLIERVVGGGSEKGTRLTETGKTLLAAFTRLQEEKEQFLDRLHEELGHDPVILQWFKRLFMKSSARNQWSGKVANINLGAVTAEIGITLSGGATLVASITNESAKAMNLAYGKEVIAMVKAPMVMVVTDLEGYLLSARNQLAGTVSHLRYGPVSTEVVIDLPSGDQVVASVTSQSCDLLGLKEGSPATAVFKAGSVVLAVSA